MNYFLSEISRYHGSAQLRQDLDGIISVGSGNWECGRSAIHQLGGLTDEQQNQVEDIVRLIPAEERAAFLEMLAHELRGRELTAGELRRVAERTWRTLLQHGWPIRGPEDAA